MALVAPRHITAAEVVGAPIEYKWNAGLAVSLVEKENARLQSALQTTHFKANLAVGTSLAEWVVWRLHGYVELTDAHHRVEAAWAAVIDPAYVSSLDIELSEDDDFDDKEPAAGPLEATLDALGELFGRYRSLSSTIEEPVIALASLARHVVPNKKSFDRWLSTSLRRASKVFPYDVSRYDKSTDTYDPSYESPVPKEFFEEDFKYSESTGLQVLRDFLESLDPSGNPYLCSSDAMLEAGFRGTPYRL